MAENKSVSLKLPQHWKSVPLLKYRITDIRLVFYTVTLRRPNNIIRVYNPIFLRILY